MSASPLPGDVVRRRRETTNSTGLGTTSVGDVRADARTVTVKSGDSLSKIAKRELGDANKWHAIFDANRDKISNPDMIHPGQVLKLPNS